GQDAVAGHTAIGGALLLVAAGVPPVLRTRWDFPLELMGCRGRGCAQPEFVHSFFARARARERCVGGLVVGWAEHPQPGVAAGTVVEALDVLEDLAGQLAAGRP